MFGEIYNKDMIYLLIPFLGLFVNIISHLIIFRVSNFTVVLSDFIGFFIGFVFVFLINCLLIFFQNSFNFENIIELISNVFFFSMMGFLYFAIINIGESSLRIRILMIVEQSKNGITEKEIYDQYNSNEILENRIKRMTNNGQIIEKDGRFYFGKPRLFYFAKFFEYLRLLLIGNRFKY